MIKGEMTFRRIFYEGSQRFPTWKPVWGWRPSRSALDGRVMPEEERLVRTIVVRFGHGRIGVSARDDDKAETSTTTTTI